jgi:flagellar secretion chaperone FliS
MSYPSSSTLAAYRNTAAHGGVAAADPHGLILLLMNSTLERISAARGCIKNKAYTEKARLIHSAVGMVDLLRNSLNLQAGGALASNLDNLYEYMCRQLLQATVDNNVQLLDEVNKLLQGLRDSWQQIPLAVRAPGAVGR